MLDPTGYNAGVDRFHWIARVSRSGIALVLTAAATVAVTGCGAGGPAATTGGSASSPPQFLAYADCMRSRGVPDYPDGGVGNVGLPSSIDTQAPAYVSAQHACARDLPAPVGQRKPTERQRRLAVAFSACVRGHGLPRFPDPTLSVPAPGVVQGIVRSGMYWPLPAGTVASPAFQRAAAACGWQVARGQANAA